MISKLVANAAAALADVPDGATVMIGGFGTAGQPMELIDALLEQGAKDLVIINNNAGNGTAGLAALLGANRVRKIICSFPRQVDSQIFDGLYRSGKIELELVPQGNLAERIRAAGAGIGVLHAHGLRHAAGRGQGNPRINGRQYVLEYPLHADYALIKAERGDRWGNLVYRKTARNFGPSWPARRAWPWRRCARSSNWASSIPRTWSPRHLRATRGADRRRPGRQGTAMSQTN